MPAMIAKYDHHDPGDHRQEEQDAEGAHRDDGRDDGRDAPGESGSSAPRPSVARTVGGLVALASRAPMARMKPTTMPPKCAISAQVFSSLLA
jgi:hypothetical protein